MSQLKKIVITGGFPGERASVLRQLQAAFTQRGYSVLILPDGASALLSGGITPQTCGVEIYGEQLLRLQLETEKIFCAAATGVQNKKCLLLCGRGAMDGAADLPEWLFTGILQHMGCHMLELRDEYDAVFHLPASDSRWIAAWTGHPHLRMIRSAPGGLKDCVQSLLTELSFFLGDPEPLELERKYLIEYPDIAWLDNQVACRSVSLVQTYLKAGDGEERRVRRRSDGGGCLCYETVKRTLSGFKRVETERRISEEEYQRLLKEADPDSRTISKTRYYLAYADQYFELDIYPFWQDKAIVELECSDEHTEAVFPKELKVIREVTYDADYKNAALARLQKP